MIPHRERFPLAQKPILRAVGKLLIPFILLFALYVQFHGDFGPGGGFQAGVLFAAGLILYGMIFGGAELRRVLPPWLIQSLIALGLMTYGGVGVATLLLGGKFLDYNLLAHDPRHGQHLGILLVELGVGVTVCAVMVTIYNVFSDWKPPRA